MQKLPQATIAAALFALASLATAPAWAVNKCTGADGKVQFQDAPCMGKGETITVRPASGAKSSVTPEAANAIASGGVFVGMTAAEVRRSWGAPHKINATVSGSGTSQQWVYRREHNQAQYIYLDNGVVRSIQSPQ
jgi:hypothetical protein